MATLSEMLARLGLDTSGFSGPLNSAQNSLNTFASNAMKAGSVLTGALTVPIAAIGVGASKAFIDFDAAMTQSLAIMGDLSKTMRDDMAMAARQMAKESTFSAKQVADAYYFLASAGLDAEASIKALPVVTKFAQAGMFDMALATDLLTDAQSALGLTIRDDAVANMQNMIKVSDVLVKANILSNASVQQFSESLTNKAGSAIKILNKDLEEGVAVLAAYADQGVKGSEAGDKLNIVLRDLQTSSIENRKTFEAFGITVFDAQGKMRNMADIISDMERALGPMSDEQKRATLTMLGFQDRSVAATLQLVGYSDQIRKYEAALREAGGTTEDVANRQLQSFSSQLDLLKNRVTDSGIAIGSALVPMLGRLMDLMDPLLSVVESLARGFTSLNPTIQVVIVGLAAIVAAIGPLLVAAGGLAWSMAQLIPLFGATATASGLATAGIMGIAKAVPIAAAAYAGWKLGEWLQSFTTEYKDAEKKVQALSDSLKA
ncbi:MAG TPA: phage tail tape measure protein [Hyphomicrobiaceae bacterium]|nr:phage tail tape measure protein [Hyphomicrobiaceae bacterium]